MIAYVQEHIGQLLSVDDLAERVLMHPSALADLFQDVTGKPPCLFFRNMRLSRARAMLIETGSDAAQSHERWGTGPCHISPASFATATA